MQPVPAPQISPEPRTFLRPTAFTVSCLPDDLPARARQPLTPGSARTPQRSEHPISAELPLAQHVLPSGLAATVYKRFNQVRKALATAYYLHISHRGALTADDIDALTQHQMATAARSAGVEAPNSEVSRGLIRDLLRVFNGLTDTPTLSGAAETANTADELTRALTLVVQAAARGVSR